MEIYKILLVTISIFLISDFENLVISVISNKISGGAYEIWQQLVTPWTFIPTDDIVFRLPGATITFANETIRIMNMCR